ncbi:hypothetical protein ACXWSQ_09250 [Streptococcus pyogenes]
MTLRSFSDGEISRNHYLLYHILYIVPIYFKLECSHFFTAGRSELWKSEAGESD